MAARILIRPDVGGSSFLYPPTLLYHGDPELLRGFHFLKPRRIAYVWGSCFSKKQLYTCVCYSGGIQNRNPQHRGESGCGPPPATRETRFTNQGPRVEDQRDPQLLVPDFALTSRSRVQNQGPRVEDQADPGIWFRAWPVAARILIQTDVGGIQKHIPQQL